MRTKQLNKCTLAESQHFKVLGYSTLISMEKVCFLSIHLPEDRWVHPRLSWMRALHLLLTFQSLPKPVHGHELAIATEKSFEETTPFWAMRITPSQITHCSRVFHLWVSKKTRDVYLPDCWLSSILPTFPCGKFSMLSSFSERLCLSTH